MPPIPNNNDIESVPQWDNAPKIEQHVAPLPFGAPMELFADDSKKEEIDTAALRTELEAELERDQAASWKEVCRACFCHTRRGYGIVGAHLLGIICSLYFFLFSLDLMGNAAKVMGGCTAGALFGGIDNPIAGLCIGILATVLLQSSSTSTSIIVSLVGADAIEVKMAIYIVMGANIGTSVTNTIVAMGQMGDKDQLQRAFAGATVHDVFNYMSVVILLPIEAGTQYLYYLTRAMTPDTVSDGDKWKGPIKTIVGPLTKTMIIANKKVTKEVALGTKTCGNFYPVECLDSNGGATDTITYENCVTNGQVGLITCDKDTNNCPAYFQNQSEQNDDELSGWICFFLSIFFLVICLVCMIKILSSLLLGSSKRILRRATNLNGYLAMLIGAGITILVQSSSITTSVLTPLAGLDIITLEVMFPITLGANIGTTITGILAALVSSKQTAMQVALAHLFFNISGIIIFYPIPWMRQWPLKVARWLGLCTRRNKYFPIFYIIFTFFLFPLSLLGISILWAEGIGNGTGNVGNQRSPGLLTLAIGLTIGLLLIISYYTYQFKYGTLKQRYYAWGERRSRKSAAIRTLADDMDYLKDEVARLGGKKQGSGDEPDPSIAKVPEPSPASDDEELEVEISRVEPPSGDGEMA